LTRRPDGHSIVIVGLILLLLVVWLVLSILGFVIHGLFWLAVIGIVLFLATGGWGWLRNRTRS
jgi:hypothetical protein